MENYLLYFHRNPVTNGIFYVGIGDEKRPYSKYGRGVHWQKYISKYGDYKIEIAERGLSREDAIFLECNYIQMFGRKGYEKGGCLVNSTTGGDAAFSFKHTEETKKKISAASKIQNLGRKASAETKLKQSLAKKGKKLSPEHIAKIAAKNKGRKFPKEFGEAISIRNKANPISAEQRAKMTEARRKVVCRPMLGKHHKPEVQEKLRTMNIGRKHSEETRLKYSLAQKKLQRCAKKVINKNTGVIYDSISLAAESIGENMKTLSFRLNRPKGDIQFKFITN